MSEGLIGSYWGVNLENKVISQSSTTLAVFDARNWLYFR